MTAILEGEVLPPAPDEPGEVTLPCDESGCGESFTGPSGGKGSAPMLLGRHRYAVHGISKNGKGRRAKITDAAQAVESRHPLVSAVAEAGAQVKGTGTPRAPQLSAALGRGLSIATLMAAGWAVDSDPLIHAAAIDPATAEEAAQQKEALTRLLALSEDAATRIAAPVGRLLAPTELNRKYGRALVDNTDLGPAVAELVDVGRAWKQFLDIRRAHVAELRATRQAPRPGPYVAPTPDAQAAAAGPGPGGSPLGGGRVATPTYRTA